MKEPKTKPTKSLMDTMEELGQKYGVKVTDMIRTESAGDWDCWWNPSLHR